ncbi:MAG: LysM peptidoglycan-binding domain-containing protein [Verrucomicrobiota bacterium]|jgi:LysM repeat protein|nr:LysM peptidoglycan-binding domain-containing protein [Verrucomicrobiota bacterium]
MKPTNPRASHPQWSFALALAAGALITVGCVAPGTTGGLSPAAQQRLQHEANRDLALDEIQRLRDQIGAMERQFSAIDQRIYALEDSIQQVHMRTRETAQTQPTVNPADLRRLEQSLNQLQTARAQDRQETVKAAIDAVNSLLASHPALKAPRTAPAQSAAASSNTASNVNYVEVELGPGDTLTIVAQAFGTTVDEIVRINNLKDPNKVGVGQKLRVPKR